MTEALKRLLEDVDSAQQDFAQKFYRCEQLSRSTIVRSIIPPNISNQESARDMTRQPSDFVFDFSDGKIQGSERY